MGDEMSKPAASGRANTHYVREDTQINWDCHLIKEQQEKMAKQQEKIDQLEKKQLEDEQKKVRNAQLKYEKEMEEKRKREELEIQRTPEVMVRAPTFDEEKEEDILKLFYRLDYDGSGYIEPCEFMNYINNHSDMPLGKERAMQLYNTIKDITHSGTATSEEKGITLDDWKAYFKQEEILEQEEVQSFHTLPPEKLANMTVEEFLALQTWTNNRIKAQVNGDSVEDGMKRVDTVKITLKSWAKDAKVDKLDDHMRARWQPFASFKRRVDRATVMFSNKGVLQDLMPGQYNLSELTRYKDLGTIKPARTLVRATWVDGRVDTGGNNIPAKLLLPSDFSGKLEVDIATTETVGYYGASLGDGRAVSENLTLEERHVMQDFTYGKEYLNKWVLGNAGGAALETHAFAHLDCPLGSFNETGHFILAKWSEMDKNLLEITAFMVPNQSTIYTPGGVMHTNNYLQGTWRTMLADGPINEAKMHKNGKKFNFVI